MRAFLLMTGGGPMIVLCARAELDDDVVLGKLKVKGVTKFIAYELPIEEVRGKYGGRFEAVLSDLHETDDLRVLDVDGHRVFELFRLDTLGAPFVYEPAAHPRKVYLD